MLTETLLLLLNDLGHFGRRFFMIEHGCGRFREY